MNESRSVCCGVPYRSQVRMGGSCVPSRVCGSGADCVGGRGEGGRGRQSWGGSQSTLKVFCCTCERRCMVSTRRRFVDGSSRG